jgi:hypothetical protein
MSSIVTRRQAATQGIVIPPVRTPPPARRHLHPDTSGANMAGVMGMPHIDPFDPEADPASLAIRWEEYLETFCRLMNAFGITDQSRQRDCLLVYCGAKTLKIYKNLKDKIAQDTSKE